MTTTDTIRKALETLGADVVPSAAPEVVFTYSGRNLRLSHRSTGRGSLLIRLFDTADVHATLTTITPRDLLAATVARLVTTGNTL